MKTREELEAMGFTPEWASVIKNIMDCAGFSVSGHCWSSGGSAPASPLFTPGHEPVSKEGRELLEYIATHTSLESCTEYDRAVWAYRDSLTPKPPEFEGWKRNGEIYNKGNNASVWMECDNHYAWQVDHARDIYCGCRDTLPEAIKAAEDVMRLFGGDPNPWHKTDGMAPPEEAGDRVIETVDGEGTRTTAPAAWARHEWASGDAGFRPTKWRYADGGQ